MIKDKFKRDLTFEDLERSQEELSGSRGDWIIKRDVRLFTPENGENCIRILPFFNDDPFANTALGANIHLHRFPTGDSYVCLLETKKNRIPLGVCPICEARNDFPDDVRKTAVPGRTLLMWILNQKKPEDGVMLWTCPPKRVGQEILKRMRNRRTGEPINILDPDTGRNVYFEKSGSGLQTEYFAVEIDTEVSPVSDEVLKEVKYFEEVLEIKSEEFLRKVVRSFLGGFSVEESDEYVPEEIKAIEEEAEKTAEVIPPAKVEDRINVCFGHYGTYSECANCPLAKLCQGKTEGW